MGTYIGTGQFAGRYDGSEEIELTKTAAEIGTAATTVYSKVIELGGPKPVSITLDSLGLTAASGGTNDVTIQGSEDGSFTAPALETLATFTQVTTASSGVTRQTKAFTGMRFIRARIVTTGTTIVPNFTLKGKVGF